jgi:cytochrome c oxidase subunit 4
MLRDDVIEYSLDTHHDEEHGKKVRAKIWKVTALLTIITVVEVIFGSLIKQNSSIWPAVKWGFIILTLAKAAFIVLTFMHLGDERRVLRYIILVPYCLFIVYLIFIMLTEAHYVSAIWAAS